ncbi:MAG: phospho-N-acetylmuramoyl-pentapeptide-transferase, partial [Bacteroidales bacterium]|nr:phospho-N-acetylmuramoyl-pentapeptide-transferase [Bacteroidales bacterium]
MLYHLFQYLESLGVDFPGMGLMQYLSFRAMGAAVTAVLVAMIVGKKIIRWLQLKQIGETVRDLGLEGQIQKKGTPTMGGIIIILSIVAGVLLWCDLTNIYVVLLLVSTLWCG